MGLVLHIGHPERLDASVHDKSFVIASLYAYTMEIRLERD